MNNYVHTETCMQMFVIANNWGKTLMPRGVLCVVEQSSARPHDGAPLSEEGPALLAHRAEWESQPQRVECCVIPYL